MTERLRVALVGGPMYDRLYRERLPAFTAETGIAVDIGAQMIHPELNDYLDQLHQFGTGTYDLISTHTKYAASQAAWLRPLDDLLPADALDDFTPAMIELARVEGRLLGLPRNLDTRLFHYRHDLFTDPDERKRFSDQFGRGLGPPATWDELREVARFFTRPPELAGFAFPGQSSGLWGTFFELTAAAGGQFFKPDLRAGFNTDEGAWALGYLRDLHSTWHVTPPDLPSMQFDAVSRTFQAGRVAVIADWPATFASHVEALGDRFDVALYPSGPVGRFVYSGGFTWAIPRSARDVEASMALMLFLTSPDSQRVEAEQGTVVTRRSVQETIQATASPDSRQARREALLEETIATSLLLPPRFAAYAKVEDVVWPILLQAITGEVTVTDALAAAATQVDAIVSASA